MSLIFPESSFKQERKTIQSQLRDTYNRLHSIQEDANFVCEQVQPAFPDFPTIPNQRAGAWYVKPNDLPPPHAYFKSTDGHAGQHDFNLRRANLVLLHTIVEKKGIILVDSTRRGKRFPDALSKTVPTWCAVLNRARIKLTQSAASTSQFNLEHWAEQGKLWTLPSVIGRSEHAQIESKIDEWAQKLIDSAYDLSVLKSLDRPLRPLFVSPSSKLFPSPASEFSHFFPIVCVSASKLAKEEDGMERARGYTYVQGSGDDHEAWSQGLTPPVFWANADKILSASRDEIDRVISNILKDEIPSLSNLSICPALPTRIRSTETFLILASQGDDLPTTRQTTIIHIEADAQVPVTSTKVSVNTETRSAMILARTEKGLRELHQLFVVVRPSAAQSEANEMGLAVLVIILVRLFDDDGKLLAQKTETRKITKDLIRSRLQCILECFPTLNPSRAILQRVNNHLMSTHTK